MSDGDKGSQPVDAENASSSAAKVRPAALAAAAVILVAVTAGITYLFSELAHAREDLAALQAAEQRRAGVWALDAAEQQEEEPHPEGVASPTPQAQPVPPPAAAYDSTVATAWFDLYLDLVQGTPGFSPPVASRAFGYAGVTLYEAVVPGMPDHQTLAGQLNELPDLPQPQSGQEYHWPTVANSALASLARRLFPTATPENRAAIDALEYEFAGEFARNLAADVYQRSVVRGQLVAHAIYVWSLTDGDHEGYLHNFPEDYIAPTGPGMWVSTPPGFSGALQPAWGQNRPFALESGSACAPPPPPVYSEDPSSDFYAEGLEVYNTVSSLTAEQKDIALFWADNPGATPTPPGHWISIVNQIVAEHHYSLDVAAEAYARVGMAVADAFIGCWRTKYEYNLIRPITYIQQVIDPTWNTPDLTDPVVTPPFPEYTSGHSVQSAAAAQVLTDMFGEHFRFTDHTHDARGLAARTFSSFVEAADEAALSRLYGGIHYRAAIENGLAQGRCIGQQISALHFRK